MIKGTSRNSHLARCGRFLKAQKDPQPAGRQILMDSDRVANPVTAHNGAAPGVCSLSALHNLLSRAICQFLEVP